MPAVPIAPSIFFQSLNLSLACPGVSEQSEYCEQQDNWHYTQDQRYKGPGREEERIKRKDLERQLAVRD